MIINPQEIRQAIGETGIETGSLDAGPMSVVAHVWPKGFDATDLLRAACGETLCPVPHYFIVMRGSVGIRYVDDGSEERCDARSVAYLRPGHTVWAIEAADLIELSPADGNAFLNQRIAATGLLG